MKNILTLLCVMSLITVSAQNYNVTFRVDMSQASSINSVICVAGDFQAAAGYSADWTPGITLLTDPDVDSVYDITVSLPAGTYEYKFFNGGAWGNDETVPGTCAVNYNRQVVVTGNVVLDAVCFGECAPCASGSTNYSLTFKVDMSQASSINSVISVAGDFQAAAGYSADWTPGITLLTDPDVDSVYDITVSLPAGTYEYKFFNGGAWGDDETVPGTCAVNYNRQVVVTGNVVLDAVCFGECAPCASGSTNYSLTFRVDMSQVPVIAGTVSVTGDFQAAAGLNSNWTPGAAVMSDPDLDQIYSLTVSIPAAIYEFKYVNGTAWGQDEIIPGPCSVNGNRSVDLNSDLILDPVCFSGCGLCSGSGIHNQDAMPEFTFVNKSETAIIVDGEYRNTMIKYMISDICGRQVLAATPDAVPFTIDISDLESGLYFLNISSFNGIKTYKFVHR